MLIQSEAFLSDEEASAVVDQHVFAVRSFCAGSEERLIRIALKGLMGPVEVRGKK